MNKTQEPKPKFSSFRWKSDRDIDVDAFFLGEAWVLFVYLKNESLTQDKSYWQDLAARFSLGKVVGIAGALKTPKGSSPLPYLDLGDLESKKEGRLWAKEGELWFCLEVSGVLNPGLFLDQTENRKTLTQLIHKFVSKVELSALPKHEAFLNLFSYTGAFTLAALKAGAWSATSVDLNSRYLEWEKTNIGFNFESNPPNHRLLKRDARDYLKQAANKKNKYQWIVIDPPTFSRGDKVFQVQKELPLLVEQGLECLAKGGALLASSNDSRWSEKDFNSKMAALAKTYKLKMYPGKTPMDFPKKHPLKSVWIGDDLKDL